MIELDYLILAFGSLLLAFDFALNKIYQKIYGTAPTASLLFNMLAGAFTGIIFFFANGCHLKLPPFSVFAAATVSILVMSYNIIGFRLLKTGTMALYTLFLMTGGMTLPYIWGLLFLNESASVQRIIGLLVIICSVVLSGLGTERPTAKQLLMCCAVFVINGFVSITSKVHQINTSFETVDTVEFVILQGILKLIVASALFALFKARDGGENNGKPLKKAVLIALCSAILGGLFSVLQLTVAVRCPASVLYPFNTGLTIIMSALTGVILFKERLSVKSALSIALCFVGTLMFI